jgi:hypothetical protein
MVLTLVTHRPTGAVTDSIIFGCDGKSALDRIKGATKGTHFDLVTGILACRQDLADRGVVVSFEHVKGHQDRLLAHRLTFFEELNIKVDRSATRHNAACRDQGIAPMDSEVYGEIGPLIKIYSDLERPVYGNIGR